jgi:hypothetical protein
MGCKHSFRPFFNNDTIKGVTAKNYPFSPSLSADGVNEARATDIVVQG